MYLFILKYMYPKLSILGSSESGPTVVPHFLSLLFTVPATYHLVGASHIPVRYAVLLLYLIIRE